MMLANKFTYSVCSSREMADAYSLEIRKVATRLLTLITQNWNLKPDYFNDKFGEDAKLSLRLNYYPPCPQPELVLGLHPHSDPGSITLLVQDYNTEGLNIRKETKVLWRKFAGIERYLPTRR